MWIVITFHNEWLNIVFWFNQILLDVCLTCTGTQRSSLCTVVAQLEHYCKGEQCTVVTCMLHMEHSYTVKPIFKFWASRHMWNAVNSFLTAMYERKAIKQYLNRKYCYFKCEFVRILCLSRNVTSWFHITFSQYPRVVTKVIGW